MQLSTKAGHELVAGKKSKIGFCTCLATARGNPGIRNQTQCVAGVSDVRIYIPACVYRMLHVDPARIRDKLPPLFGPYTHVSPRYIISYAQVCTVAI